MPVDKHSRRAAERTKNPTHGLEDDSENLAKLPYVISLFSGAGGLDLGFGKAGFDISLAIDISEAAVETHKHNFTKANSLQADLIALGPDGVLSLARKHIEKGSKIGIIGGPPCQGFSRANTQSYSDDPRNKLPDLYIDIIRSLQADFTIEFIVFENVPGIKDKKHSVAYSKLLAGLNNCSFKVVEHQLCASNYGVPQTRHRIVLTGLRKAAAFGPISPLPSEGKKTVRCVLGQLQEPAFFARDLKMADIPHHPNHWTMKPKSVRFLNTTPKGAEGRSFKRLDWDKPSPTIAFGHREIHVHPAGHRRLSIFEAMLLQGFPENYVLKGNFSQQSEQVSNAVPPPMAHSIALAVKLALQGIKDE